MSAPKKKKTIQKTAEKTGLGMDLLDGVRKGNVRAIARMISLAEAAKPESRPALAEIFRRAGNAHVIGITGVPGSGKSTLVRGLAKAMRSSGRRVGIVAIDPSSPFSGGAILGETLYYGTLDSYVDRRRRRLHPLDGDARRAWRPGPFQPRGGGRARCRRLRPHPY